MVELLRTNDPVLLSYAAALLSDLDVDSIVLDSYTSVIEGSIGALPRRLMVRDEDEALARQCLREANLV
jgi:Putative prokaryotic signal transducing protein